jgi:hypothetical protein
MAADCDVTQETDNKKLKRGQLQRVRWSWTAHTDGSVSAVGGAQAITGRLRRVEFKDIVDASSAGSLPSSGYDVTLVDKYGYDWLFGLGANLISSMTALPLVQSAEAAYIHATSLMPSITNAGNSTQGVIDVLYEVM